MTGPVERAGAGSGATSQAGPLGRVDPADPKGSADIVRPRLWTATGTVVIGLFGLVASLVVLGSVAEGVRTQEVFALDAWATPFLHAVASPGLDAVMNGFTFMGSSTAIVPLLAVLATLLFWRRRRGAAAFLVIACVGALVLNGTMKLFFQRPRPSLPWATVLPDYSFPSGHTMNSTVFYIAVALIVWSIAGRRVGVIAVIAASLLAIGVGVSRIYLGYHYFTDVVGGILGGVAWLLVLGLAFRARPAWREWRERPGHQPTA